MTKTTFRRFVIRYGLAIAAVLVAWALLRIRPTPALAAGALVCLAAGLSLAAGRERLVRAVAPSSGVRLAPFDLLLLASSFGLVAGLAEAATTVVRGWHSTNPAWRYSADVVWMAPVGGFVAFSVLGLLLIGIVRVLRIEYALRAYSFVLSLVAVYVLLKAARLGIATEAAMLLAVGIAVQLTRLISRRGSSVRTGIHRATVGLVAVVVSLGVGQYVMRAVSERHALANLPAAERGFPNVLLIILDTVRATNLSLYGYVRPTTPELDQFARQGIVFDRAVAPAPWTLPSHASMFTGRFPHELTADWETPLDDTYPTLAEVLAARGYETIGVVGNLFYTTGRSGLQRGFIRYREHPISLGTMLQNSWIGRLFLRRTVGYIPGYEGLVGKSAERVNGQFLRWLDRRDDERPFFAFLNYMEAHSPYLPPPPFGARFARRADSLLTRTTDRDAEHVEQRVARYDGEIAYLDSQLGHLFRRMQAMNALDDTIVIITSDHGEHLGERGAELVGHGNSLYAQLLRVPLVIVSPGRLPAGLRVDGPADLRDLPSTVLDLVGLGDTSVFPGRSLSRHWNGLQALDAADDVPILSELTAKPGEPASPAGRALTTTTFRYIHNGDGSAELYDLMNDPGEQSNLAGIPNMLTTVTRLRLTLDSLSSTSGGRAGMQ